MKVTLALTHGVLTLYNVASSPFLAHWLTMTDGKRVFAIAEEGGLCASTAGELYGVLKSTANIMATEIPEG